MDGSEGIMLREVSKTEERQISYNFAYMWNRTDKTNEQTKQKQAQIHTGEGGWAKQARKGIKRHKIPAGPRNKLQHKEYSQ